MDDVAPSLLDPAVLRQLLQQLEQSDVEELEVVHGDSRIYVQREAGTRAANVGTALVSSDSMPVHTMPGVSVAAPLAGVFYSRPSPDEPPFVQRGDVVDVGTVVGLIETMKMYNEVSSDVMGEVLTVAVGDGDLVESGQALLYVRPMDEESVGVETQTS